ncbi:MAG TPA: S53 family peptidase [Ktedonobacteraceae bacterium]|jgi:subtilase family serine protease|nr:S53 family peptidase [Ktedonobacteraceae bacterium]
MIRKISAFAFILTFLVGIVGSGAAAFAQSTSEADQFDNAIAYPTIILQNAHGTRAPDVNGFTPQQFRKAYGIDQLSQQGAGITIAIVDACGNPHVQSDLDQYDQAFGLPSTTVKVVYPQGKKVCSAPSSWGLETDLDVEMAHAVAPQATIVLEVTVNPTFKRLDQGAQDAYVNQGAADVSMSFGGKERPGEKGAHGDAIFAAGNAKGVTFTASSGDSGCGVSYPAASPDVVAVGGTVLTIKQDGTYVSETTWSSSGGGLSKFEHVPSYQNGFNNNAKRGVPDVAMVATGMAMYDSDFGGFVEVAGTSIGAPIWSGVLADANSGRQHTFMNADIELYSVASNSQKYARDYHDITTGSSGGICNAGPGYDFPTGLGSPVSNNLVPDLIAAP